ncbi:MAG: hypothetical protein M4579_001366 [Chaenotheca gracillima]|nr:MAG: hypothetical protein M4579_001366 [Chaenotheca gracillima]
MDVDLYVYDISRGLARQYSGAFLGVHIEAVYHTSIVFGGVEYFFGAGIQTCSPPASTHHGRPMEVIRLGTTSLPSDVIATYLDTLSETYTADSYDLFLHNCNNFTNDFSEFLVGKTIPERIGSLPRRVMETPFGAMMKQQIDAAMRPVVQQSSHPSYGSYGSQIRAPAPVAAPAVNNHTSRNGVASGHPHRRLHLPVLDLMNQDSSAPIQVLPSEEEINQLEKSGYDPALQSLWNFVRKDSSKPRQMPLPDLDSIGHMFFKAIQDPSSTDPLRIILQLLNAAMQDRRVSGFFAAGNHQETLDTLFKQVEGLGSACSDEIRICSLQIIERLFNSGITVPQQTIGGVNLISTMIDTISDSLTLPALNANVRIAASRGAATLSRSESLRRKQGKQGSLSVDEALGLASAVLHAINAEESSAVALRYSLAALGFLMFLRPVGDDDVWEFLEVSNAVETVRLKAEQFPQEEKLIREVGSVLFDIQ